MIRGTTASFKFILPYDYDEISAVTITFWQPKNNGPTSTRLLPIVKVLSHCSKTNVDNELIVNLDVEETLRFTEERKAYVQMTGTTIEGSRFGNRPREITVYPLYNDGVDDNITPTPTTGGLLILDGGNILEEGDE